MNKRSIKGFGVLLITTVLVYLLDHPLGALPAIGRLVDPMNGCWANAEPVNEHFSGDTRFEQLKGTATIWYDERLVPHIHAGNDHDLYFLEGFIHAKFRLWQMDMQTRAAAGRVSEVVGDKALKFDNKQRYKGMGFAAENSLRAMEADPRTKVMMDAYTEGVNAFINCLNYRSYPFEYKLMGFAPEPWTNLKSALMLKLMADDLTGGTDDIALTYLRDVLPKRELDFLFPDRIEGSKPAIPEGTTFDKPSLAIPAAPADSIVFPHFNAKDFGEAIEEGKGSNNWALSGKKTVSGFPILCNDPHLGLSLPSLWYEVQLQMPGTNAYGVSLPGTPGIVIGFNDSISWGFTNNYRDVKDFYLINQVTDNKNKYWFAGKQLDYTRRVETIKVKNKPDVVDTINYTIHGPVTYAEQNGKDGGLRKPLAMCWMAHRSSNEMLAIYLLNKAGGYEQFVDAILNFQCPAQNIVYVDMRGNIALWGQGQFVNKWKDQGRFVMNGSDSATLWKELIPMRENPHALNPEQGYLCSANQITTDSTYPYNYNGAGWVNLRAWHINDVLRYVDKASVKEMFALQQDTYSALSAAALPVMLKYLPKPANEQEAEMNKKLRDWDNKLAAESEAGALFQIWWAYLTGEVWRNKLIDVPNNLMPLQERMVQLFPGNEPYTGEKVTPTKQMSEVIKAAFYKSFKSAIDSVNRVVQKNGKTGNQWYMVKNTSVNHLTKLPALSYDHLKTGGWGNTVNAMKGNHGPSWRMVVQMGKEIEAYGVYPGGQSGNPGSKYYADFLQYWVEGNYYRLAFLPNADKQIDKTIKYTWTVHP